MYEELIIELLEEINDDNMTMHDIDEMDRIVASLRDIVEQTKNR